MTESQKKDGWDKTKIGFDTIKVLVEIGLIVAVIIYGNIINTSLKTKELTLKENELKLKYIEIAVGVLQSEPDSKLNSLRAWAVDIIDSNPEFPLSDEAKTEILDKGLPTVWNDKEIWNDLNLFTIPDERLLKIVPNKEMLEKIPEANK